MRARWGVLALVVLGTPGAVAGQEDFRSADLDRPTRVEDATPAELRAVEIEVGTRGALGEDARALHGVLELKAGLLRNTQLGLEVEGALERADGDPGTETGLEAVTAHLLYGLAREGVSRPALALRVDVSTPGAGTLGRSDWQAGTKGIVTRSLGRLRVHGNGGYTIATDADGGDYWRLGLGLDYPIGLFSRAVLADVYAEVPASGGRSRVWVDVGGRLQVTNWTVLDVGVATRLDEWEAGRANVEIVVGLSRILDIPGLARVAPYPDPVLR